MNRKTFVGKLAQIGRFGKKIPILSANVGEIHNLNQ